MKHIIGFCLFQFPKVNSPFLGVFLQTMFSGLNSTFQGIAKWEIVWIMFFVLFKTIKSFKPWVMVILKIIIFLNLAIFGLYSTGSFHCKQAVKRRFLFFQIFFHVWPQTKRALFWAFYVLDFNHYVCLFHSLLMMQNVPFLCKWDFIAVDLGHTYP